MMYEMFVLYMLRSSNLSLYISLHLNRLQLQSAQQTNQTLSPTVAVTRPDTPSPTPAPITPFPTEPEPTSQAPKPVAPPTTKMPYMSVNYSEYHIFL